MDIRILTDKDAEAFWALRLEALERTPCAFGQSAEEHRAITIQETVARLRSMSIHDSFIMGAFADGILIGTAGFRRHQTAKTGHKGTVWGVYVTEKWRTQGIGRALLSELLRLARAQSGLEQVTLTVGTGETVARRLYCALGFEAFGHEHHALKVGDAYVDEDHMVLRLIPSAR